MQISPLSVGSRDQGVFRLNGERLRHWPLTCRLCQILSGRFVAHLSKSKFICKKDYIQKEIVHYKMLLMYCAKNMHATGPKMS